MKKLYYLIMIVPVLLLLGSCSTSKKTSITDVNYNNQITGKGNRAAVEPVEYSDIQIQSATETIALQKNYADATVETVEEKPSENLAEVEVPLKTATNEQPVTVVDSKQAETAEEVVISKKEKRAVKQHIKKGIKNMIADNSGIHSIAKPNLNVLLLILAFFIPPLAVGLAVGITKDFWINLILTLLFFVPGVIHAIIIVVRNT